MKNRQLISPLSTIEKNQESIIVSSILRLASLLRKRGDAICHQFGVTTQQWLILLYLAKDPNLYLDGEIADAKPMLAADLADVLNVSRPNITNLLNSLIEKGLVRQEENTNDRREKHLILTTEGIKVVNAIEPLRHKANKKLLAQFSDQEKDDVLHVVRAAIGELIVK